MDTQLKICLFGHDMEQLTTYVDSSPFPKGTKVILRRCKNCTYKIGWAYPDRRVMKLDGIWVEKKFFSGG